MPTIRTAAGKGAKLTPTEADSNMKRTPVAKSSNYTLDASHNREVHELGGSITTVTLPGVSSSFTETDDWSITLINTLTSAITIDRNGQTIDGASSNITLNAGERVTIWMNAVFTGFYANRTPVYSHTTVTADNNFTSGTIYLTRIGNVVTLYYNLLQHTSATTASTSTGLIPVDYRPSTNNGARNFFVSGSTLYDAITVQQNGTLTIAHYDAAGALQAYTNSAAGCISYIVP